VLVTVGPLAAGYTAAAAGVETRSVDDAQAAADTVSELLRPGDVILVKGSRAVGLEAVAAKLTA